MGFNRCCYAGVFSAAPLFTEEYAASLAACRILRDLLFLQMLPNLFFFPFKEPLALIQGRKMELSFGLWPRVPLHPCRFSLKAFPTCSATAREIRFTSCPFGQVLKKHRLR
jgi:hypothetical protein